MLQKFWCEWMTQAWREHSGAFGAAASGSLPQWDAPTIAATGSEQVPWTSDKNTISLSQVITGNALPLYFFKPAPHALGAAVCPSLHVTPWSRLKLDGFAGAMRGNPGEAVSIHAAGENAMPSIAAPSVAGQPAVGRKLPDSLALCQTRRCGEHVVRSGACNGHGGRAMVQAAPIESLALASAAWSLRTHQRDDMWYS